MALVLTLHSTTIEHCQSWQLYRSDITPSIVSRPKKAPSYARLQRCYHFAFSIPLCNLSLMPLTLCNAPIVLNFYGVYGAFVLEAISLWSFTVAAYSWFIKFYLHFPSCHTMGNYVFFARSITCSHYLTFLLLRQKKSNKRKGDFFWIAPCKKRGSTLLSQFATSLNGAGFLPIIASI